MSVKSGGRGMQGARVEAELSNWAAASSQKLTWRLKTTRMSGMIGCVLPCPLEWTTLGRINKLWDIRANSIYRDLAIETPFRAQSGLYSPQILYFN